MKLFDRLQFALLRIIYSKLTEKILLFSLLQIVIQGLPLLIESAWQKLGYETTTPTDGKSYVITIFFLAGTAWISVPSFIDNYPWKKFQTKILKYLSYLIGAAIIVVASLLEISTIVGSKPQSFFVLVTVGILLFALLYICIAHFISLKRVSIRLLWIHQAQFAGIYSAKYAGIFERVGLRVKINEPEINSHPVNDFDASEDDFAIVAGIDVIRMWANHNQRIRSVLPIVRTNPFIIYAKREAGIHEIKDLVGKKIGIQKDYETEIYFKAFVQKHNLNPNDFEYVSCDFDVDEFVKSDNVAQIGYVGCEPVHLRQRKVPIVEFNLSDKEFSGYADTIVVEEAMLQAEKPVVRAFVDAVIKGWKFTAKNKEVALIFIMHLSTTGNKNFERNFLNRMLEVINGSSGRLGDEQSVAEWQGMIDFLVELGVIKKDHKINVSKIIYDI